MTIEIVYKQRHSLNVVRVKAMQKVLAQKAKEILNGWKLNTGVGCYASKHFSEGGRFVWKICFNKKGKLDGDIIIINECRVSVRYQTSFVKLPNRDIRIFNSMTEALDFIKLAFVDYNFEAAREITITNKRRSISKSFRECN